jgi:hypothetical protein
MRILDAPHSPKPLLAITTLNLYDSNSPQHTALADHRAGESRLRRVGRKRGVPTLSVVKTTYLAIALFHLAAKKVTNSRFLTALKLSG